MSLPYGIFSLAGGDRRVGVAYGDQILDLTWTARSERWGHLVAGTTLNPLMAAGRPMWEAVRAQIAEWLEAGHGSLVPANTATMHMPFDVADYVDFYSSRQHAENLGRMFRPDMEQPLLPNWKHLPVGYHGRAGTVVVSGTPIRRPSGQRGADNFGPSMKLDIEAEVGFVVGAPSRLGHPVPVDDFADHVFGVCLVNDWSARDIQAWEYVPLGPFLGKSFATSISPWIVPLAALEAARVAPPPRDFPPLPYLDNADEPWGLDLALEVRLNGELISSPPFADMYWTPAQQMAHMTINGASLRTGDLFASGTVSGSEPSQYGSLIELTWNGQRPHDLVKGFLQDGDEVTITATAPGPDGTRFSFGEVSGRIEPPVHP